MKNIFTSSFRALALFVLVTMLAAPSSAAATLQASDPGCTYMIDNSVEKIDGLTTHTFIKPGYTLCLPAGTRGNLKLMNLHGAPGQPITVRNSGGIAVITGDRFVTGGIGIDDSSNIRVTGTGVLERCGAEYAHEEQACGISIIDTVKGIKINTKANKTSNIEIDHVSIHKVSTDIKTRGITIHPLHNQLVSGVSIHHNHVYQTMAEGIYIGTEPHGQPFEVLGKLENVEISYNLVEETGYDSIKLKLAIKNVAIHHNVLRSPGLLKTKYHEAGIKVATSVGDFYNNIIIGDREGIVMGRPLDNPGTRYFNNVIVGAQLVGIGAPESNAQIFNNTVVNSGTYGITATGKEALIYNNIIVETSGTPLLTTKGAACNNLIGSLASAGFIDPFNNNFSLAVYSPAVDAGSNSMDIPPTDAQGFIRPQGDAPDLGAYERTSRPPYRDPRWILHKETFSLESCN